MGRCFEFGTQIEPRCDHPMVANRDCCTCPECGVRCPGKYSGCAEVWARGTAHDLSDRRARGIALAARADRTAAWTAVPATATLSPPLGRRMLDALVRGSSRSTVIAALGVALTVALVGVLIALRNSTPTPETAVSSARSGATYEFAPTTVGGATIQRTWVLTGENGNLLQATVRLTNPESSALDIVYDEVIPKSMAPRATDIRFDPTPTVIEIDPIVRFVLHLGPGVSTTIRYEIDVAPGGANRSRLKAWASHLARALAAYVASTSTTTSTTLPPTTTTPTTTRRSTGTTRPRTPASTAPTTPAPDPTPDPPPDSTPDPPPDSTPDPTSNPTSGPTT